MTYSQRSTHSAASSDFTYLEYQIGLAGEELKQAERSREACEAELKQLRASVAYDPVKDASAEEKLLEQTAKQQEQIEAIRAMLAGLEDELAKLADE
jgi:chromosome segregation ATPase